MKSNDLEVVEVTRRGNLIKDSLQVQEASMKEETYVDKVRREAEVRAAVVNWPTKRKEAGWTEQSLVHEKMCVSFMETVNVK